MQARPEIAVGHAPTGPIVATTNQAMDALQIGRARLYELLNAHELESYRDGASRKITWSSIRAYIERRLKAETNTLASEKAKALAELSVRRRAERRGTAA